MSSLSISTASRVTRFFIIFSRMMKFCAFKLSLSTKFLFYYSVSVCGDERTLSCKQNFSFYGYRQLVVDHIMLYKLLL